MQSNKEFINPRNYEASINRQSHQIVHEDFLEIEEDQEYALPLEGEDGRRTDHYNKYKNSTSDKLRASSAPATGGNGSAS